MPLIVFVSTGFAGRAGSLRHCAANMTRTSKKRRSHFFDTQKQAIFRLLKGLLLFSSVYRIGHQGDGTGALDGLGKLALVFGAIAAHSAGNDLPALIDKAAKAIDILIIDILDFIHAESANFPARFTAAGPRPSF